MDDGGLLINKFYEMVWLQHLGKPMSFLTCVPNIKLTLVFYIC